MGWGGRCMKPNGYRVWDGGTAARCGGPLSQSVLTGLRDDSRAVFLDTALPRLSAPIPGKRFLLRAIHQRFSEPLRLQSKLSEQLNFFVGFDLRRVRKIQA